MDMTHGSNHNIAPPRAAMPTRAQVAHTHTHATYTHMPQTHQHRVVVGFRNGGTNCDLRFVSHPARSGCTTRLDSGYVLNPGSVLQKVNPVVRRRACNIVKAEVKRVLQHYYVNPVSCMIAFTGHLRCMRAWQRRCGVGCTRHGRGHHHHCEAGPQRHTHRICNVGGVPNGVRHERPSRPTLRGGSRHSARAGTPFPNYIANWLASNIWIRDVCCYPYAQDTCPIMNQRPLFHP